MDIQEKLESVFNVIENMEDNDFFNYFVTKKERRIESMELRIEEESAWYETKLLSLLLCGTLMEISALKNDAKFPCFLLANSVNKGRYLIDRRKQILSQFLLLKYISLSKDDFTFRFFDVLDEKQIKHLVHSSDCIKSFLCSGNKIILHFDLNWDESTLCRFLVAVGELITRVHQDGLTRKRNRVIKLGFYQPFFKLITDSLHMAHVICNNLMEMRSTIRKGFIPKELVATNTTWRKDVVEKRYRVLNQYLGEHIEYCVYIPKDCCFVIRFKLPLDMGLVSRVLLENSFSVGTEEHREIKWGSWIRKGGVSRPKKHFFNVIERPVFFNGVKITYIQSDHIIKIPIGDEFESALKVFSLIYDSRAFISGWFETHDAPSDLSSFQKTSIMNIDDVLLIYSYFAHSLYYAKWEDAVKNEKSEEIKDFNPRESVERAVYRKLCACDDGTHNFYRMLNSFLLQLEPDIDEEFGILMKLKEDDTKEKAKEIYDKYRHMLRATGELINKKAAI